MTDNSSAPGAGAVSADIARLKHNVRLDRIHYVPIGELVGSVRLRGQLLAGRHELQIESQARFPIPAIQLVARGHPPCGDDVRPLPAELAERRGPAL